MMTCAEASEFSLQGPWSTGKRILDDKVRGPAGASRRYLPSAQQFTGTRLQTRFSTMRQTMTQVSRWTW